MFKFLSSFLSEGATLTAKTMKGIVWKFISFGSNKVLSFISTIILARLLIPEDFGLVAVGHIVIDSIQLIGSWGFAEAFINKRKNEKEYFTAFFYSSVLISTLIFLLVFFFAPLFSIFFENPASLLIIRVMAVTLIIKSFIQPSLALIKKRMDFKKASVYGFINHLLTFSLIVLLAFLGLGVWSLVVGRIFAAVFDFFVFFLFFPIKPMLAVPFKYFKDLFGYGKYMFTSTIFVFLLNEGDDAFVGKLLGVATLGVYTLAFHLANFAVYNLTFIVSQVVMPAYASIQDSKDRLKSAYFKVFRYIALLAFPSSLGIFILAPEIVPIVYSPKWNAMIYPLMILCIYGLSRSLIATTGEIFKAVGKPKLLQKVTFIQLVALVIFIYPLTKLFGLTGTCLALTLAALSVHWLNFYYVAKVIGASFMDFVKVIYVPLISSVIMLMSIYLGKKLIAINSLLLLILYIIFGALVYSMIVLLFDRNIFKDAKGLTKSLLK